MDLQINGKVAVVTGGAKGIGRAISLTLAREGVIVALVDVNEFEAKKVIDKINSTYGKAIFYNANVANKVEVKEMVNSVINDFGKIDILINNAGIRCKQVPWYLLDENSFDETVAVNFKGVFLCTREVVPIMIKQRSGKIIMISSCTAKTGEENNGTYSATKAAINNMTQSLAFELGRYNITVNAICPAAIDTDLMKEGIRERAKFLGLDPNDLEKKIKSSFKLPRELKVNDVANAVLFLASNLADNITGDALNVSSGLETH